MESLVPGRECGACTACCTHLNIDTEELQKFAGVDCQHLVPQRGCRIYERRPQACREWYCAWRSMANMPDDWRPDRSGVLVAYTADDIPPHYATRLGLKISLIKSQRDIRNPGLVQAIVSFVQADIPVFLLLQGPPGRVAKKRLVNDELRPLIEARDMKATEEYLLSCLEALEREPKEPVVVKYYARMPR